MAFQGRGHIEVGSVAAAGPTYTEAIVSDLKAQILADLGQSAREEVLDYEDELRMLAQGLAYRLQKQGKDVEDVATDSRVYEWAHALPLESAYAPGTLCFLVEEALKGLKGREPPPRLLLNETRAVEQAKQ